MLLSKEEYNQQVRARRLVQLANARAKKKEIAALDKIAVAQGLPKPSVVNRAAKKHPLLLDDSGNIRKGFDPKKWLSEQTVSLPVVELLALSSEYNQSFKEALGYSHSKSTHHISTSPSVKAVKPLANPSLEGTNDTREVSLETSSDVDVTKAINQLLTKTFDKVVAEGGVSLQVVQLSIGEHDFDALLDNGATVSLIPLSILKQAGLEGNVIKDTSITLSFAGRRQEKPYGIIKEVPLLFSEDLELVHSFAVVDFDNFPLILGMDFMMGARATVTPHLHELSFDIMNEDRTAIENQVIIDTHDGTGINKNREPNTIAKVMNVIFTTNSYNEKVIELVEDVILNPLDITPVTFRVSQP